MTKSDAGGGGRAIAIIPLQPPSPPPLPTTTTPAPLFCHLLPCSLAHLQPIMLPMPITHLLVCGVIPSSQCSFSRVASFGRRRFATSPPSWMSGKRSSSSNIRLVPTRHIPARPGRGTQQALAPLGNSCHSEILQPVHFIFIFLAFTK